VYGYSEDMCGLFCTCVRAQIQLIEYESSSSGSSSDSDSSCEDFKRKSSKGKKSSHVSKVSHVDHSMEGSQSFYAAYGGGEKIHLHLCRPMSVQTKS
jgi:hypothetical protein